MATVSVEITIPDAHLTTVVNAFATATGWTPDSGLTKANHSRAILKDYFWQIVKRQMGQEAGSLARAIKEAEIDLFIT